jgi:NADPH-dependent curcumin reductase CurA
MITRTGREYHLASRPVGWPTPANFALVDVEVPEPGPGQVLVRNTYLSVDPYMRGRMNDVKSYVPPFQVGQVLDGGAMGEVIASGSDQVPVGATVVHNFGWRELALFDAKYAQVVDPSATPSPATYLGALGIPGLTAYVGLIDIANMHEGDVVFVSGAAGAVGSIAGQLAKMRGASRVIGSAGSAAKVKHLTEDLGFDAAFNYKDGPTRPQLKRLAPDGIDVYFDNVGGEQLEASIAALNRFGRVAVCGAISQYNESEPVGPRNMALIITKRLTLRGFIVLDHNDRQAAFVEEVGGWLREGKVKFEETVVDGLENAPDAFLGLLRGENLGKMLVKIAS